jgi:hypothetical protein
MTDDLDVNAAPKALVRSKVVTKPMIAQVYGSMSLTRKVSRVSDILHWHNEFISGNTSLKMTPDDEMSVEKCIRVLLGSKSLELVRFLTSTQKCEAFNRTLQDFSSQ